MVKKFQGDSHWFTFGQVSISNSRCGQEDGSILTDLLEGVGRTSLLSVSHRENTLFVGKESSVAGRKEAWVLEDKNKYFNVTAC